MRNPNRILFQFAMALMVAHIGYAQAVSNDLSSPIGNLLRNASFELDGTFNGSPMRQGTESFRAFLAKQGKCIQLPVEGWWQDGSLAGGVAIEKSLAHSGSSSLLLTPDQGKSVAVFSAPEVPVKEGAITLSAWVLTTGAHGKLGLEFVSPGPKAGGLPRSLSRKEVAIPETASDWTRVQLTGTAPAGAAAVVRITADSGRTLVDDVQLEKGGIPSDFNIRTEEFLHLSFKDFPEDDLPFWKENDPSARSLLIRNDSRSSIEGSLEIWAGPWSSPKTDCVAVINDFKLAPGAVRSVPLALAKLHPDAYVVVPILKKNGVVLLDGDRLLDPTAKIGGEVSNGMLKSQAVIRFAITRDIAPAEIFGVGNGMIEDGWNDDSGSWFGGWPLHEFAIAKAEDFVCGRGRYSNQDVGYLFAAAGVPLHRMNDKAAAKGAPANSTFGVPGQKGWIDFYNPEGMALVKSNAEQVGKENGGNPLIASYQMDNEAPYPFRDGICATAAADANFRAWCRQKYGNLDVLNRHWGTAYKSWDEVEQPVSAHFADEMKKRPVLTGTAAVDWLASLGKFTPELVARLQTIPGRGMEWLCWRTWSSLWLYNTFRDTARQFDKKTLYSVNLCWPEFHPQMCMPFFRKMDVSMIDSTYTAGLPRDRGGPMKRMEILEMIESNAPDKPFWGIEMYVQPQFPAGYISLQDWGLVAHGMTNDLVFGWGPYANGGIPKTTRAWEKSSAVEMFALIDLDGTKLPGYYTNKQASSEIQKFHEKFNALSIKRIPTDIAFFVSRDTADYIMLEAPDKPWTSEWIRTRNNLAYLLRMNGITADFVDDETMPDKPGRFNSMIIPASYALSQESAMKIAAFARNGGMVILAGVSGVVDPWTNKYECLGGSAWGDLSWKATNFTLGIAPCDFLGNKAGDYSFEALTFKGAGVEPMPNAEAIHDAAGTVVGWKRPWGKGRIIAYSALPDSPDLKNPHPSRNLTAWMKQLIEEGGLNFTGRWNSGKIEPTAGMHGEGAPVVDVVVRARKGQESKEKFVFVLNQGGAGEGTVEVPVSAGALSVTDATSGNPVNDFVTTNGVFSLKLAIKPWEYRVFHLTVK